MLPTVALVVSHLAWMVHIIYFAYLGAGEVLIDAVCSGEICQSASGYAAGVEAWKLLHPDLMQSGSFNDQMFLAAASLILLAFILVRTPTIQPALHLKPLYLPPVC